MENNKDFENSNLEVDSVKESAKKQGVLFEINNPESVNMLNKQQAVFSATENKQSRNKNNGHKLVEGANKSKNNVEEKSQIQARQKKKKNIESKALSQIDEKDTENTIVEKKAIQRKNARKSVTKQSNEILPSKPITCLPSTSSTLANGSSRKTEEDKTKKGSDESNQCVTIVKPNYGPSNKNALITLFPHVGLPYFPDSSKATPVPRISNKRKLPENCEKLLKPKKKIDSIAIDTFYRDAKMTPPPDSDFLPLLADPESLESKKNKSENVIGESQYPQPLKGKSYPDAVLNPPLANPGTMVGYTPAGQRFEVDLNLYRPTWFSSEYARVQFDDATKINVSRMMHEMESGSFLPAQLDADMERNFTAEQARVKDKATEIIKEQKKNINLSKTDLEEKERRLFTEDKFIDLVMFAMLRHKDFPIQVGEQLKNGLSMKITPLMFKKHPVLLELIEELSRSGDYLEVTEPAQALLDKIKGLFNVPATQTFDEYFEYQVEILQDATKHMNLFEILTLTEEPNNKLSDGSSGKPNETPASDSDPQPSREIEVSESEGEDEWIAVDNNDDSLIDIGCMSEELYHPTDCEDGNDTISTESELSDDSEDLNSSEDENESEDDDLLQIDIIRDSFNGTLFDHGYPDFIIIDIFDYI